MFVGLILDSRNFRNSHPRQIYQTAHAISSTRSYSSSDSFSPNRFSLSLSWPSLSSSTFVDSSQIICVIVYQLIASSFQPSYWRIYLNCRNVGICLAPFGFVWAIKDLYIKFQNVPLQLKISGPPPLINDWPLCDMQMNSLSLYMDFKWTER